MRYKLSVRMLMVAVVLSAANTLFAADSQIAFVGARVIDGTGADPMEDAVILVENGRISAVGPRSSVTIPASAIQLPMDGKTIIPGLINAHGHVSGVRGLESGHYNDENLRRQLALYARYGVTTVNSLGDDGPEGFRVRNQQNLSELNEARLLVTGTVLSPQSVADAATAVDTAAEQDPAFIKIRVDDNLGRTRKMPPEISSAIASRAEQLGIPLAVHTFYLQDTKDLLNSGAAMVAHSVRDQTVDQEFIDLMRATDACYTPTLTREVSTFVYENEVGFFSDPFFLAEVDPADVATLRDPERQQRMRENSAAQQYKAALPTAMSNLKLLSDAGIRIALGTDSGPVARFQGYFEHLEMWMMADAGMSPMQILTAATSAAAGCLSLPDTGSLQVGNWADLLILDQNPLEDIRATRSIHQVWIAGNKVQRPAL